MVITEATWFENKKSCFKTQMPKLLKSDEAKMMKMRRSLVCKLCGKTLTNKEFDMHVYVCEKVPQEIFRGGTTNRSGQSLQNTLWR